MRDEFLESIIAALELRNITDFSSVEFADWCMLNDFIPFNLRYELNSYISNLKELK